MARRHGMFWTGFTVVLSVVFAVLFFPAVRQHYDLATSVLFTSIGVVVIWAVYLVRTAIFGSVCRPRGK